MDEILDGLYPELTLETDDIIMTIAVKKDYSKIKDLDKRKEEFINDCKHGIETTKAMLNNYLEDKIYEEYQSELTN